VSSNSNVLLLLLLLLLMVDEEDGSPAGKETTTGSLLESGSCTSILISFVYLEGKVRHFAGCDGALDSNLTFLEDRDSNCSFLMEEDEEANDLFFSLGVVEVE